jgi:hypothetical protein
MLLAQKHNQHGVRRFFCLLLVFFMFFLQSTANVQILNFFPEKTTETEKEESRTEKESEENLDGESSHIGKSKKAKKQLLPPPTILTEAVSEKRYVGGFFLEFPQELNVRPSFYPRFSVFFSTSRYVVFHSLVFYEI